VSERERERERERIEEYEEAVIGVISTDPNIFCYFFWVMPTFTGTHLWWKLRISLIFNSLEFGVNKSTI
jgi:hypothetical protein